MDHRQRGSGKTSFNSRPHKEVDGVRECIQWWELNFQFTTSQGGRRDITTPRQGGYLSIHDLTRRSTHDD